MQSVLVFCNVNENLKKQLQLKIITFASPIISFFCLNQSFEIKTLFCFLCISMLGVRIF